MENQLKFFGNLLTEFDNSSKKDLFSRLQRISTPFLNTQYNTLLPDTLSHLDQSDLYVAPWTPGKKFLLFATCIWTPEKRLVSGIIDIECVPEYAKNFNDISFEDFSSLAILPLEFGFVDIVYEGYTEGNEFQGTLMIGEMNQSIDNIATFVISDTLFIFGTESIDFPIKEREEFIEGLINPEYGYLIPSEEIIVQLSLKSYKNISEIKSVINDIPFLPYYCEHIVIVNSDFGSDQWIWDLPSTNYPQEYPPQEFEEYPMDTEDENSTKKQFRIRGSANPECYFLFELDSETKVGLAFINGIDCSFFVRELLENKRENTCWCIEDSRGWIPYSLENNDVILTQT